MSDNLCIYHGDNCVDGFVAAFIINNYLHTRGGCEFMESNYLQTPTEVTDEFINKVLGKNVYIVDFSYPLPFMKAILENAATVIWLDHHQSSIDLFEGNKEYFEEYLCNNPESKITLTTLYSGAKLTWYHCFKAHQPPKLVNYVNDRDTWAKELPYCDEVHAYLAIQQPYTFDKFTRLCSELESAEGFNAIIKAGTALKQQLKSIIETSLKNKHPITITGVTYVACNGSRETISDLGEIIAKEHGVGVVYIVLGDTVKISLRSTSKDVEAIARYYGGGGHKTAASFKVSLMLFADMVTFAK
jgi:oligoribonuclease NrnB/cAMP/cGMP phosphodiesterase (DHH superfamily)